uniref:Ribonuclease P protein component n=1 Tax=Steinernema glaseri TaxID=37863 RepID=A0A1I7ZPT0_9BILA
MIKTRCEHGRRVPSLRWRLAAQGLRADAVRLPHALQHDARRTVRRGAQVSRDAQVLVLPAVQHSDVLRFHAAGSDLANRHASFLPAAGAR